MSIGTVVTEGFGSFGDIAHVITDGYSIGAANPNAIATIITEAFGASSADSPFVVTEGFRSSSVVVTANPVRISFAHFGARNALDASTENNPAGWNG